MGSLPVVAVVRFRSVVGNRNRIGARKPAVEVDIAAAFGAEGIVLPRGRAAAFGTGPRRAEGFDVRTAFLAFAGQFSAFQPTVMHVIALADEEIDGFVER